MTTDTVWICVEEWQIRDQSYCQGDWARHHTKCGERRLVPPDALVIERDADGQWPEWARQSVYQESLGWFGDDWFGLADEIPDLLDALAASQEAKE